MFDKSQLLKGTLEGCILRVISLNPTYGYEIVAMLNQNGFPDLAEGTVYPLLLRLEKKELIQSEFRPSPNGPSRKYYTLTQSGQKNLEEFYLAWQDIAASVHLLF